MLWLITRVNANTPGNAEAREAGLTKHREYLRSQKGILLLSGALRSDDGEAAIGSFFIVNVETRAAAQAFVDGDPNTQAGHYVDIKITRIRRGDWNPEVAAGTARGE
jgi:uncharacterized protein